MYYDDRRPSMDHPNSRILSSYYAAREKLLRSTVAVLNSAVVLVLVWVLPDEVVA